MEEKVALTGLDYRDLIEGFEKDIKNGGNNLYIKMSNSIFQKEMVERGKQSLKPIAGHLRLKLPAETEVCVAWVLLMCRIKYRIKFEDTPPRYISDIGAWIKWAEKLAR